MTAVARREQASASITTEIVNPIIESVISTFDTMFRCRVHRTGLAAKKPDTPMLDITAVIGLSGEATGSVCLSFSRRLAFVTVKQMLDEDVYSITPLVCDTVGEFANIAAGMAKDRIQRRLTLGLPNVVHGPGHQIEFPSGSLPLVASFMSDYGPLSLAFGFVHNA
jgi:chemotaxis protein CheX